MPATPTKALGILEGLRKFLLWVGGTLAGITAVLYACGFLVTRAHVSMLGLYGLVGYGNDHFLQEGGRFLFGATYDVLRTTLPLAVLFGAVALPLVGGARALRGTRTSAKLLQVRDRVVAFGWWRHAAFAVLFLALNWHAGRYLDEFTKPLAVSNLLYADRTPPAGSLEALLLGGVTADLYKKFENLLVGTVGAVLLAIAAWRVVAPWRWRAWLVAPFVVAAALYLMMLPLAYGVLQRPARYALVTLHGNDTPGGSPLFLLAYTGAAFVVWDSTAHRATWVPASEVKLAEIRGAAALFGAANASGPAGER